VRLTIRTRPDTRGIFLDPARLIRWIYVARVSIAAAILLAAVVVSLADSLSDTSKLIVAEATFAATAIVTLVSVFYSKFRRAPLRPTFYYLQSIFDLLLVTAVVHVTRDLGVSTSQFAALYILVIATGSLLLPAGGGLFVAALGNVLYVADTLWSVDAAFTLPVGLQLGVFAAVALGIAYLSAKLQESGAGTEAELAHVRLQAADILFNIRSGVITIDAHGRLMYANPMAEQLLGVDLEALHGADVLSDLRRVAPELTDALELSVHERIRTTRGEGLITSANRRFHIGVTTTYTDGDGQRTDRTATAIFQDISEQKQTETLRLRAERLEGIAELSASLAHEIKNPLASIRSAVEQLSRSPFSGADEQALAHLVMRESDRLSRLLSEFLDFARVQVARREPVDLADLISGAVRLALAHPDLAEGVTIVAPVEQGRYVIEGDDDLLHRAVFNLLLNAVQASPAQAVVRIDVRSPTREEMGSDAVFKQGAVAIVVSDRGSGIAPEIRDRLFDPFFTTKPGGSGLGLAVVHRAIDAHRGLVLLDSSPAGTRFTIVLAAPPHVVRGEQPAGSTPVPAYT
jgi:two-component system sensor histidine kinase PilS (NtrC family)